MRLDKPLYYYVGVQFEGKAMSYHYLCQDLSVRVGDEVLVPVFSTEEKIGKVVSAVFCTADDVPYPLEKTKTVIRKIDGEKKKAEAEKLVSALNAVKTVRISQKINGAPSISEENRSKQNKRNGNSVADLVCNIIITILATPILTLILGFFFGIILAVFGWETDDGYWLPFVPAFLVALGLCIYEIENGSKTKKSEKRHVKSRPSDPSDNGWYPGCPEENLFSSTDDAFDFDGDGHLDSTESSTQYDIFFGGDE